MSEDTLISIPHLPAIALVGNPGAGKSTLLNGLAGSPLLKIVPNSCEGQTEVLQAFRVGNLTLYDTPGLIDIKRIRQAGEELDKLLSENVALKIVFVVALDGGRVRKSDTLTIKLVLDAISLDANDRFGIVINKMEDSVEALIRENPQAECNIRKQFTDDRKTCHWCYVPMETSLVGAKDQCHMTKELNLLLHGLPVMKPLYTVVSSAETQNLKKLLEAAELRVREIENAKEEEFREMIAGYELQNLAAEKRISALEQASPENKSKILQSSKQVQNIEDDKREGCVADDLNVPFIAIQEGRQSKDCGNGVLADPVRAVHLYNRAIEEGNNVNAMVSLAWLLQDGADGVSPNPVRAVHLYNRAIEEGRDVIAMTNLARLLKAGADGVPADPVRAAELYYRAIEEGHSVIAMNNLAWLLQNGADGVSQDPVRAVHLYNRAIQEGGKVNAMVNLAWLLQNGANGVQADPARAVHLYHRAIEEGGNVNAMVNLACLLQDGADGLPADLVRSAELYNRAIEEGGNVKAMVNLARLLRAGADGVPADTVRAAELYSRAIEEGHSVIAMNNLAWLLQDGADGVPADPARAVQLYNRAIEEGAYVNAMVNLAWLLQDGANGVSPDPVRAVQLYNRAIEEGGNVQAMVYLGWLLQDGADGVPADPVDAAHL